MTVRELADALGLRIICAADTERPVSGGYAGDLLSWVMGRAKPGCAWVTVMSSVNVAAVASLADIAVVILAESAEPDADLTTKAELNGINICASAEDTFSLCVRIGGLLC